MRKKIRRAISAGLALFLCVCMLPLNVLAEGLQDAGTDQNGEVMESLLPEEESVLTDETIQEDLSAEEGDAEEITDGAEAAPEVPDEETDEETVEETTDETESEDVVSEPEEVASEDVQPEETSDIEEEAESEVTGDSEEAAESEVAEDSEAAEPEVTEESEEAEEVVPAKKAKKGISLDPDEIEMIRSGDPEEVEDIIDWISADDMSYHVWDIVHHDIWWNPETEKDEEVEWDEYNIYPESFTVKLSGQEDPVHFNSEDGGFWGFVNWFESNFGDQVEVPDIWDNSDQKPGVVWQPGTEHNMELHFGNLVANYKISIEASPVKNVRVDNVKCFEGSYDRYEEDDGAFVWYGYRMGPRYMEVELEDGYVDGNVISGDDFEVGNRIREIFGDNAPVYFYFINEEDAQYPEHIWGVGVHPVQMKVLDKEVSYSVEVVANPILSIEVGDLTVFDNELEDRDWYEDESGKWNPLPEGETFPAYRTFPDYLRVETTEGVFETSDGPEWKNANDVRIELAQALGVDENSFDFGEHCDQRPDHLWTVGEHEVIFRILGKEQTYHVNVEKNPILNIYVDDMTVFEGDCFEDSWYEDENGEGHELPDGQTYLRYNTWPEHILVETTIGEFGNAGEDTGYIKLEMAKAFGLDPNHFDYSDHGYQSPENRWGVGKHEVTFRILGVETKYNVTVEKNPIQKVEAEGIRVLEGAKERRDRYRDEETKEDVFEEWYAYRTWPSHFKIWTSDTDYEEGDDIEKILDKIAEDKGLDRRMLWSGVDEDNQSPDSEWEKGVHNLQFNVCGVKCAYSVEIIDNPIKTVTVSPKELVAGDKITQMWREFNPETGEEEMTPYDAYDTWPHVITVELKNGETLEDEPNALRDLLGERLGVKDIPAEVYDDQSPTNEWEPGQHVLSFMFGGILAEYDVTILNSPVVSVSFPKTKYLADGDTFKEYVYWDRDGVHIVEDGFDKYGIYPEYMEVVVADIYLAPGEKNPIIGNPDDVLHRIAEMAGTDVENVEVNVHDDIQTPERTLEIGEYEFDVSLAGKSAKLKVEVVPFPVKSIGVEDIQVYHDETVTFYDYEDSETHRWIHVEDGFEAYDDFPKNIRVVMDDDTVIEGSVDEVAEQISTKLKEGEKVYFDVYPQSGQTPEKWDIGIHPAKFRFGKVTCDYNVRVMSDKGDFTGIIKEDNTCHYYEYGFVQDSLTGFVPGPVYEVYDARNEDNNVMVPGTEGKSYYFVDGVMQAGKWVTIGSKKYHLDESGALETNCWVVDGSKTYHVNKSGAMQVDCLLNVDGTYYRLKTTGVLLKNSFYTLGSYRYFFGDDGVRKENCWFTHEGKTYYAGEKGIIKKNTVFTDKDGKMYAINSSGVMQKNGKSNMIAKAGSKRYVVNKNGVIQVNGWKTVDGKKYYAGKDGAIVKRDWVVVGSKKYHVDKDGVMQTGWLKISKKWYYFTPKTGVMVYGKTLTIDGKKYKFDKNGVCTNK